LESVAAQSYRNLQIIIVDDGSTDRTAGIAESFCAKDERALLLCEANGGVASARNHGLAAAGGEWIAMIDSDDLWHRTKIEKQMDAAQSAGERPGLVYCWFRTIDGDGRVTGSGEAYLVEGPSLHRLTYVNFVGNGSAPLFLREAAVAAGGFDESLQARGAHGCDDALIQLRVASAWPVAVVPEYLVGYRNRPGSVSDDQERMFRSWGLASDLFRAERPDVPERIVGWNLGRRCLTLAERRAIEGRYGGGARMLAKAAWLDPARTARILAYRAARLVRRKLKPGRERERPFFLDLDTRLPWSGDRHEIAGWAKRLARFERSRMDRLAAADRRAALAKPLQSP
jgi:glycosyltransferase involved in cell wall biosynthesis